MTRRRAVALLLAAPWVAWALVRVAGLDVRYPLVAVVAFTPYAALTAPLPALAALVLRERAVALVAVVAWVALVAVVVPRALGGPDVAARDAAGRPVTVMTVNLRYGRADPQAVARLVRDNGVDVLALEELTPEALGRLDGAGLRVVLPGRLLVPRVGAGGAALMARGAVARAPQEVPAGAALPEAALTLPAIGALHVQVMHPTPPISTWSERVWRRLIDAVPGPAVAGGALRLVAGDFNGTLDQRTMRRLLRRGYVDAADAAGAGLIPTYHAFHGRIGITIDHVLVPGTVGVDWVRVRDVPGSDHRAVIARLLVPEATPRRAR